MEPPKHWPMSSSPNSPLLMQPHAAPPAVPSTPAPLAAGGKPREEGLAPQIWVAGLIGIIVILLIVFSIVL